MTQLEKWDQDEVVCLGMSEAAFGEALAGSNPRRRKKAIRHFVSLDEVTTAEERSRKTDIADILFPNGVRTENENNDVRIVFNAGKYGAILVTADGGSRRQPGGILGNRERLARLNIRVMSDGDAVDFVRGRIVVRDDNARWWSRQTRNPLPEWVGAD